MMTGVLILAGAFDAVSDYLLPRLLGSFALPDGT
jgi:hypothetical protein